MQPCTPSTSPIAFVARSFSFCSGAACCALRALRSGGSLDRFFSPCEAMKYRVLCHSLPVALFTSHESQVTSHQSRITPWKHINTHLETTLYSSRGGSFERRVDPTYNRIARTNTWQVPVQRPSRLALLPMAVRELTLTRCFYRVYP